MTEFRKVIQCPNCRFANRLGDKRCLICKAELPQATPGDGVDKSPLAAARGPNPATNNAAAARAASGAKAPTSSGVPQKRVDQTATQLRPAVSETFIAGSASELEQAEAPPPKPLTKRVNRPNAENAVAWLWCDPLPPIPLVTGRTVIVGRQDTCDLVLPHKEVSRQHAVFKVSGRQISLEDQGSSNGCYVNGKRSANHVVKVGDMVQIGPYEIEIRATDEDKSEGKEHDTKSFDLTSINSGGPGASMTGKLSEVPLVEILQTIEFNGKTCTLAISDGKLKGKMVFAAGRPQTATFGGDRDLEAVRAMMKLREGRFVLTNEVEPGDATMNMTVTALLLDASRERDEADMPPDAGAFPNLAAAVDAAPPSEDAVASEAPSADAYGAMDPGETPAPDHAEPTQPPAEDAPPGE
ncbi:MAG TPA: FHA domain-containing protein [Planctomycetota bacterium]|nr:FHA domain-containing protein [Planctomycetota bacterium]